MSDGVDRLWFVARPAVLTRLLLSELVGQSRTLRPGVRARRHGRGFVEAAVSPASTSLSDRGVRSSTSGIADARNSRNAQAGVASLVVLALRARAYARVGTTDTRKVSGSPRCGRLERTAAWHHEQRRGRRRVIANVAGHSSVVGAGGPLLRRQGNRLRRRHRCVKALVRPRGLARLLPRESASEPRAPVRPESASAPGVGAAHPRRRSGSRRRARSDLGATNASAGSPAE